jgi:hypothetical protein
VAAATIFASLAVAACGGRGNPTAPTPQPDPVGPAPAPGGYVAGQTYFGRNQYIEYMAGSFPIVVSAPHGGSLTPAEIPDRRWGETARDTATVELAREVAQALQARTGLPPHLVLCHLRRSKLDANREVGEAAQGNPFAVQAWNEYHAFIEAAAADVRLRAGRGFYLDLHGHGHPTARVELGYLITAASLDLSDDELNGGGFARASSLGEVTLWSSAMFAELLRGPTSLGGLLAARSYPAVPSPAIPSPGGDPYFSGGYSTARHASSGSSLGGVQIECHYAGVRDTAASREAFARALADALVVFVATHLQIELQERIGLIPFGVHR